MIRAPASLRHFRTSKLNTSMNYAKFIDMTLIHEVVIKHAEVFGENCKNFRHLHELYLARDNVNDVMMYSTTTG